MTARIRDLAPHPYRRCEPWRLRNCWLLIGGLSALVWAALWGLLP